MGTPRQFIQPFAFRIWNSDQQTFSYTSQQPAASPLVDRWTGFFDSQGAPLYERDIVRVHYNWQFGWVHALVKPHPQRAEYCGYVRCDAGELIYLGFYYFCDSYVIGNDRQHPAQLKVATEQFPKEKVHHDRPNQPEFAPQTGAVFN